MIKITISANASRFVDSVNRWLAETLGDSEWLPDVDLGDDTIIESEAAALDDTTLE